MKYFFLLLIALSIGMYGIADIRLPEIFGDNMVLQRNKPIPVWGWANPGEKLTVQFNKQVSKTQAGKDGKWKIMLSAETAGGPYQLSVTGKSKILISNVLVGEVWICSGQSNMEMTVANSADATREVSMAGFPQIRHIKIPNKISGVPVDTVAKAEWQVASPATAGSFTAVGYYFARKLYNELHVPIGLINSSWGGSMVETWISREALQASEDFSNIFQQVSFNDIEALNEKSFQQIVREIESAQGNLAPASSIQWRSASLDHSSWKKMALPGSFDQNGLAKFDGAIWFRKTIELDKNAVAKPATVYLSTIDDMDETYINGTLVGKTNTYNISRQYTVAQGILKEGANVIAVRVTDNSGNGGFFGKPSELLFNCDGRMIPLSGDWFYKIESIKKNAVNPNSYPTLLFNSMINPLIPFAIKGVLWYQGETNAARARQYNKAFPLMINDWRSRFQQGDFPFYFVQLASYSAGNGNSAKGSTWAELREAQTRTLVMPNTGMAVALDIGETKDIHPKNKQDVGNRLAAIALAKDYNKNQEFSGPVFKSLQLAGNKAVLSFTHADSGFMVKDSYGYIKGFEIAGADKQFHYAKAALENGNVVVYSDMVPAPVAVRYGWADDMPEANLYNRQGFPAVPFKTDSWAGITEDVKYTIAN